MKKEDLLENKEEVIEGEVLEEQVEPEVIMTATPDDIKEAVEYIGIPYESLFNVSLIDLAIFTALKLKEIEESCQKTSAKKK